MGIADIKKPSIDPFLESIRVSGNYVELFRASPEQLLASHVAANDGILQWCPECSVVRPGLVRWRLGAVRWRASRKNLCPEVRVKMDFLADL
jgi:hypothetical protein